MPRVLNRRTDEIPADAVYVGRGSPHGNPYRIGRDGSRAACIMKFEQNVLPDLDVSGLRGRDLVCYCAPLPCHADPILRKANA